MIKAYLAGPDVFRKDAIEHFNRTKQFLAEYGIEGISPYDNEECGSSRDIFNANVQMIDECDIVIANLNPFRGPSADPGTVWEIAYAYARNKYIYGWSSNRLEYKERVEMSATMSYNYPVVENFELADNLMIINSLSTRLFHSISELVNHVQKAHETSR